MGTKREIFTLIFHWGPRKESQAQCEAHTLRFLKGLKKVDPIFQKWRLDPWNRNESVKLNPAGMHALLERTAFRDDYLRQRMLENGYHIQLATFGPDDEHCSLRLDIGSYGAPLTQNHCTVEPPYVGASAKRIWKMGAIQELCRWIIRSWSPDSGEVFSSESLRLVDDFNDYSPRPGWIMFTTRPEAAQAVLPKPSTLEQIAGHGTLITVVPKMFNSADPGHAEQLRRVFAALDPRIPNDLMPWRKALRDARRKHKA